MNSITAAPRICDHRTDPRVARKLGRVMEQLAARGLNWIPAEQAATVVEVSEALPRALDARGMGIIENPRLASPFVPGREPVAQEILAAAGPRLIPAGSGTIADVVEHLATRNIPGNEHWRGYQVFSPPMVFIQGLYGNVSMNGWNVGFATEREYARAVRELLPADHDARISALQSGSHQLLAAWQIAA